MKYLAAGTWIATGEVGSVLVDAAAEAEAQRQAEAHGLTVQWVRALDGWRIGPVKGTNEHLACPIKADDTP